MKTCALFAALGAVVFWGRPAPAQVTWAEAHAEAMLSKLGGAHLVRHPETARVRSVALVNVGPTNAALSLAARLPLVDELEVVALPWQDFDDRGLASVRRMPQLKQLQLVGPHLTDRGLASLTELTNLEQLALDAPISDPALAMLRSMARLRLLDLYGTRVRGPGLVNLAGMEQLEFLGLDHTPLGDAGLEYVGELSSLRTLLLRRTRITDDGLARLALLPSLQKLYLDETQVTEAGVNNLAGSVDSTMMMFQGPAALRTLSLRGAPNIRGDNLAGLANLYGFPYFAELNLRDTPLGRDPQRMARLLQAQRTAERWRDLQGIGSVGPILRFDENLNLYGMYFIPPADEPSQRALRELAAYPPVSLQELTLSNALAQDEDLQFLSSLTGLRKLNLYRTRITDAGLAHLRPLANLRYLYLDQGSTLITPEGVAALQQDLPELEVVRLP